MTLKHTPSPWHVSNNAKDGWTTNPYSIVVSAKGVHRTTVANLPERACIADAQRRANAYLIAAAPELLDALISLVEAATHHQTDARAAVEQARAAIRKALEG